MPESVCVTGGTGYIALHVVRELLSRGYTVHATVRSETSARAKTLLSLGESNDHPGKLVLFQADLLTAQSFDEAIRGCTAVIHMASPFYISGISDAEKELLKPAVEGTLNVLNSCKASKGTVKSVVITSSFAAIWHNAADGHVYSEKDWNTYSKVDMDGINQYRLSKVEAEKAAWKFLEENPGCGFDIATINPPLVVGESIHLVDNADALNTSSKVIFDWLSGARKEIPPGGVGIVDVRDVALAHVEAMERFEKVAHGQRYFVAGTAISNADLCQEIKSAFPDGKFPPPADKDLQGVNFGFDGSKAERDLGISYAPIKDTLSRQIDSFKKAQIL